jgi:spoIIIJ-associated protein
MSTFKEFQAKNLDQAIQDACTFFGTEREKLEIEIIEDAKMGVFGLIGARKAKIRAKVVSLSDFNMPVEEGKKQKFTPRGAKPKNRPVQEKAEYKKARFEKTAEKPFGNDKPFTPEEEEEGESQKRFLAKMQTEHNPHTEEELDDYELEAMDREAMHRANLLGNMTEAEIIASGEYEQDRNGRYHRANTRQTRYQNSRGRYEHRDNFERGNKYGKFDRQDRPARYEKSDRPRSDRFDKFDKYEKTERKPRYQQAPRRPYVKAEHAVEYEGVQLPRVNLLELDQEKLISIVKEAITNLITPIVGELGGLDIKVEENRVLVKVESEDSGLLIGREGQHLAAIQYLLARIITTKMQVQVRIQLDTGDYHQRMQSLAFMLADRLRKTGRSQSTRPMSAYQRRVIHLALQDEPDVQTRSVGDGVLKRVIIMKKRNDYTEVPEELTADQDQFEDDVFMADEQDLSQEDLQEENKDE